MNAKPIRCAIYARFSSDQQNERSIDDQIALCRDYAARHGWHVIEIFSDAGVSGASEINRPDYLRLQQAARDRRMDVILAEDLDRLARNLADQARLYERVCFVGVQLYTAADGLISEMHIGLKGTMNALFLKNLALKVRRGQAGRVRAGMSAGGIVYGYSAVPGKPGARLVDEDQGAIVRRIFAEYLAGATPRAIAHGLNRDGIAPPRGKSWNASTINGMAGKGSGILNNALYAGRLVWNKTRMVKDPDTGRRLQRTNPQAEWQSAAVPELAIIEPTTFEAAQRRRAERGWTPAERQRAPRHLLSGLLRCATCGAGMSSLGTDRTGKRRIRCTGAAERGDCAGPRTFYLDPIENAVLGILAGELRAPAIIAEYVRTYHAERARLAAGADRAREQLERRRATIARESGRLVDAIAKGIGDADALGARTKELAAEAAGIDQRLAALGESTRVVSLHPATLARYETQVAALQASVAKGIAAGDADAGAIRDLIERVTVGRSATGTEIEIAGRLGLLLGDAAAFPHGIKCRVGNDGCGGRI